MPTSRQLFSEHFAIRTCSTLPPKIANFHRPFHLIRDAGKKARIAQNQIAAASTAWGNKKHWYLSILSDVSQAYTDGSYVEQNGIRACGFAFVVVRHGEELYRFSGVADQDLHMRNIAGEIEAVSTALTLGRMPEGSEHANQINPGNPRA